jgi:class 3 adenylate cyclase
MDGFEACKYIKAHPATQFVPLIMVTALDTDEDKLKAIEAGADDFITKPFSSVILLTRARALLKIKHLNDQLQGRNQLLRQVLNRYVAADVADIILTDPEKHLKLGGVAQPITVLFMDIRGFTRFTEKHDAHQVVGALNRIFSVLTPLIFKHKGTFDKYMGDAILAFYGAPLALPDAPHHAARTALEMQAVFAELRGEPGSDLYDLGLGIGLHSGEATVGNIGSETMMDYTVIGDTVNVAARLQQIAEGGEILISEKMQQLLGPGAQVENLGPRAIHGREEPVTVYRLVGGVSG